ncbi:flavodoxin family protein [Chitinimonas naiadis]
MTSHESFLFLLSSARRDGNTEQLARHAAASLPATVKQSWLYLPDHQLAPFSDIRHAEGQSYGAPTGNEALLMAETLAASHLVFVVPLYWYSLPADAKRYLDYWSAWMRVPDVDFKARMAGKLLSVITAVSDEDLAVAEPLLQSLRLTADYMSMQFYQAVVGYGNRPEDVLSDSRALQEAAALFEVTALA